MFFVMRKGIVVRRKAIPAEKLRKYSPAMKLKAALRRMSTWMK